MIDVLYPARNRKAFTEFTFPMLLRQTPWDKLEGGSLYVYEDGSKDGTAQVLTKLCEQAEKDGVPVKLVHSKFGSPVGVMNHYVEYAESEFFVKVDNDIVVPEGYFEALLGVIRTPPYVGPVIELLGMEAGRMGPPKEGWDGTYRFEEATHIGGVGIMRTESFGLRRQMVADGRFGFTEWQHEFRPLRGWITPDLMLTSLDQVPLEPWVSLTEQYVTGKINREWPKYHERWMNQYWAWWADEADS